MATIHERTVTANGLDIGILECGEGPLALCVHGFPDTAHSWRHLLPALADAGYHAVAPFQRGYAPTAVPTDGLYQTAALSTDANALHEALGGGPDAERDCRPQDEQDGPGQPDRHREVSRAR